MISSHFRRDDDFIDDGDDDEDDADDDVVDADDNDGGTFLNHLVNGG